MAEEHLAPERRGAAALDLAWWRQETRCAGSLAELQLRAARPAGAATVQEVRDGHGLQAEVHA